MYSTIKDFYNIDRTKDDYEGYENYRNINNYSTNNTVVNNNINNNLNCDEISQYCNDINNLIGLDKNTNNSCINITYKNFKNENIINPIVWGPSFWFSLHNGSLSYPIDASNIVAEKMKGFILGIPYMLPCKKCSHHAITYIEENYNNLNKICSGRNSLFKFYVDFHNFVNKRLGKPEMSLKEAEILYKSCVNVISYN